MLKVRRPMVPFERQLQSFTCTIFTVNVPSFEHQSFIQNDMQTMKTQIRLLLKEQSDQGLNCLPFH